MGKFLRIYRDFSGGLSEAANDNIKDNHLVEARNIMPGDGYGITRACGTTIAYPRVNVSDPELNKVEFVFEGKMKYERTGLICFTSAPVGLQNFYLYQPETNSWRLLLNDEKKLIDSFFHAGCLYWLNGEQLRYFTHSATGSTMGNVQFERVTSPVTTAEQAVWDKVRKAVAVEQRGQRWFYATADNEVIFSEVGYFNKFKFVSVFSQHP